EPCAFNANGKKREGFRILSRLDLLRSSMPLVGGTTICDHEHPRSKERDAICAVLFFSLPQQVEASHNRCSHRRVTARVELRRCECVCGREVEFDIHRTERDDPNLDPF